MGIALEPSRAAAPPARAALAFENVTKRFGRSVVALDGVSWSIDVGARACLLGPNGAGKSTSIRLLEGALQPTEGRVQLLGATVGSSGYLEARRRTGIVPQGPGMYGDLTVIEYLELARRLYGRGMLEATIEALRLGPYRGAVLANLSGGYQRRVVLAAALLGEPDLLLLDEPTVGLDPVAAHDVVSLLREAMPNRTTLLCTHNLAEAEALCDRVVILRGGHVLVQTSLDELRRRARPQVRIATRQPVSVLQAALRRRGHQTRVDGDGEGLLVGVEDPYADTPGLLRSLLVEGFDVYECRPIQPSLEMLFLEVVRGEP
jgi:ABC-2 type transport system ATP-binding protein